MIASLEVGRVYLLRGGDIVRYSGPNAGWGPERVLRALTADDARSLRVRWVRLRVRKLFAEAEWVAAVMAELRISPSRIPARFAP